MHFCAALAHLVEQLICNHQVVSSIPTRGTTSNIFSLKRIDTKQLMLHWKHSNYQFQILNYFSY